MIPNLLWRCPFCEVNEALEQKRYFLKKDILNCTHCQTVWEVRRVVGKDYWLKVKTSPDYQENIGLDLPLAEWYARMKKTVKLLPIEDQGIDLEEGEKLFLSSGRVSLNALSTDPIFFGDDPVEDENGRPLSRRVGFGRIFLTNQRFIWKNEDGSIRYFSLKKVNSFYTMANIAATLMHETSLYIMRFYEEKMLKWVTYFGHVAAVVEEETGHKITTSKY
jgi:hypothetical protein